MLFLLSLPVIIVFLIIRATRKTHKAPAPSFVTCPCELCGGHIEFDRGYAGATVNCPHCGAETRLLIRHDPVGNPMAAPPPALVRAAQPLDPTAAYVPDAWAPPLASARPVQPPPFPSQGQSGQTRALKGTVLDYAVQTNTGVISADDGQRYLFVGAEWKAVGTLPDRGMRVDFVPQGGSAVAIYEAYGAPGLPQKPAGSRDCNRLAAGLLAIFLGCLGIHKFYLGYQQEGIILLLCGTVGWLLVLPGIAAAVIGLIEGIIYLCQTEEEFQRNYIKGKKGWF